MNTVNDNPERAGASRDFVVPKESYVSADALKREQERLWPRVWQVGCRLEEVSTVGDYVTYNIMNESVIITRTAADTIKAYHNVCAHRGRRLTSGCGHTARFMCKFHGWTWNLEGKVVRIFDRSDWDGCPDMADDDLELKTIKVDTWGGFVFVNFDRDAEPLAAYLDPVPAFCNGFEFEKMRFRWYKSVVLPCNWKVALEAFNEGYHVAATHPQLLDTMGDDKTRSYAHGKHGMFGYYEGTRPWGAPSPRTGKPLPNDLRAGLVGYLDELNRTLNAITTERDAIATRRLLTEAEAGEDPMMLLIKMQQFQKEAALAEGAGWAEISFEDQYKAGQDWHVFPNLIFLPYPDGALFYRSRPNGDDPDSCIYDIWALGRYAAGAEPELQREMYHGSDDYKNAEAFGLILSQDFQNMLEVQQGMKSSAFQGARTNPLQESAIPNFHRALASYLDNV